MKTLTYLAYPLVVVASLAAASVAFAAPAALVEHGDVTIDNTATQTRAAALRHVRIVIDPPTTKPMDMTSSNSCSVTPACRVWMTW